jgi:polyhydroxyalkanoate synthesis regulator phasin
MATSRRSAGRSRPGKTAGGRSGGHSRAREAAPAPEGMRDALRRVINPLDAVVITRERLQEVLDDAVERGRMTRDDAGDLLAELVRRGRRQTDDLLKEIEGVVAAPAERVMREVDRARRATGLGPAFPILGYDDLTAAQVTERLGDLEPGELRQVRDYERRNANRKSVLAAVERKLR